MPLGVGIKKRNTICSFEGCDKATLAFGYCSAHYRQFNRKQKLKPLQKRNNSKTFLTRLQNNINKKSNGCWEWQGVKTGKGYGIIVYNGKRRLAHRFLFKILNPKISIEGLTLDHICRNKLCVNPDHLSLVASRDNVKAMLAFHNIKAEIDRLRSLVISLGGDPGQNNLI